MMPSAVQLRFQATLRRPADMGGERLWAFVVLPKPESDKLPRRGRTGVQGTINGYPFQAVLEPDGQLSHWLKVPQALIDNAGSDLGSTVMLELLPMAQEFEPELPAELHAALGASPEARATWDATTTIARIDWVHWIESARQAKTRHSRTQDACRMLAEGKKRVCCFDPSGYYSKGLGAPREAESSGEQ